MRLDAAVVAEVAEVVEAEAVAAVGGACRAEAAVAFQVVVQACRVAVAEVAFRVAAGE